MFCDQCGSEAAATARFCSHCGRPFPGTVYQAASAVPRTPVYVVPSSRVNEHIRILGILWIVYGVFYAFSAGWMWFVGRMILPSVLSAVSPHFALGDPFTRLLQGGLVFVSGLFILEALLAFFAAWGLMERQSWGRIIAILAGIFSLWRIPFGTALGIYTLWVLLPASSETEYRNMVRA